jgi:hypothetical protein
MKKLFILTMFVVMALTAENARAEDKVFAESGMIVDGEIWDYVNIFNDDTVVDMSGGIVDRIITHDRSTLNIMNTGNDVFVKNWENSTVNLYGGTFRHIDCISNVNILGEAVTEIIVCEGSGEILNIHAGSTNYIQAIHDPIINLHGGTIDRIFSHGRNDEYNVYGYNLTKSQVGGMYGYGSVTGNWFDNSAFEINFDNPEVYFHVNLVPEPSALLLITAGVACIFKRRQPAKTGI